MGYNTFTYTSAPLRGPYRFNSEYICCPADESMDVKEQPESTEMSALPSFFREVWQGVFIYLE